MKLLLALAGLLTALYGLYCTLHMFHYAGTPEYWSNIWFYRATACLPLCVILWLLMKRADK